MKKMVKSKRDDDEITVEFNNCDGEPIKVCVNPLTASNLVKALKKRINQWVDENAAQG